MIRVGPVLAVRLAALALALVACGGPSGSVAREPAVKGLASAPVTVEEWGDFQ